MGLRLTHQPFVQKPAAIHQIVGDLAQSLCIEGTYQDAFQGTAAGSFVPGAGIIVGQHDDGDLPFECECLRQVGNGSFG